MYDKIIKYQTNELKSKKNGGGAIGPHPPVFTLSAFVSEILLSLLSLSTNSKLIPIPLQSDGVNHL